MTHRYTQRRARKLWWLWIVVPIATVVSLSLMGLSAYMLFSGHLLSAPASVLPGTWKLSNDLDHEEQITLNPDGTYTWTIAGYRRLVWFPDHHGEHIGVELPAKTISGR